jgi:hypothetical protein
MGYTPDNFKIFEKSYDDIFIEFKKYIKENGSEQFEIEVSECGGIIEEITEHSYYDGVIYQHKVICHEDVINECTDEVFKEKGYKEITPAFHDVMILPSILELMLKFLDPSEVDFLSKVHREYYKNKKSIVVEDNLIESNNIDNESNNSGE